MRRHNLQISSALRSRPCRCNCCATAGDFDSRVSKGQSKARKTQWSFHYSMLSDAFRCFQILHVFSMLKMLKMLKVHPRNRHTPTFHYFPASCVLCIRSVRLKLRSWLRPSRRSAVPNAPDGQTLWWTSTRGLKFAEPLEVFQENFKVFRTFSERSQNVQSLHVLCVEEKFTSDLLSTIKLPKNAIEKSPVTV